jgi:hypothetical protein
MNGDPTKAIDIPRQGRPESVRVERGGRTGQLIVMSVDSTRLGPALGGCRIKTYPAWTG